MTNTLGVSDNRRFLEWDNGDPFFYLGDTAWMLFQRLTPEEATYYLEDRASKQYNVIQAVILAEFDGLRVPNTQGEVPLHDMDPAKPNEKYFQHVDFVVQKANELGLVMGILPTWGDKWNKSFGTGPEIFTPENAAIYGEWIGRRYRDSSVIWILGGDRPIVNDTHRAIIESMAAGIKAGDGGRNLMTFHPKGRQSSSQDFHQADWLDFNMIQSGHVKNFVNYDMVAIDYATTPPKPCIDGEPCYENHPRITQGWEEPPVDRFFDYDVRKAAYRSLFAGSFGHTYGSHDVWMFWEPGYPSKRRPRTHWRDSIQLPGAGQMQYARQLIESKPFFSRIPDQSLILNSETDLYATRDQDNSYSLIYFPKKATATIDLSHFAGHQVQPSWFDPRSGTSQQIDAVQGELHDFTSPASEENEDWVLVLDRVEH